MTLYTYRGDTPASAIATTNARPTGRLQWRQSDAAAKGDFTLIERKDGAKQWAKGGMPLYFWIKDTKEGDTTGDGGGGKWDVARP